jgi:nucleotide-binding universal stress UspA family protein
MTSVQTILHPTDFSRYADRAFQAACSLARGCGAQVIVLHVLEPVRLSTEWLTVELFGPPKQDRWEALHRLRMREADVPIEPVMRKGVPAEVILDVAREVPCDLIVMGVPVPAEERSSASSDVAA